MWIDKLLLLIGLMTMASSAVAQVVPPDQTLSLETFEASALQAFPKQWQARGDADEARVIYQVTEENGNRFLRAHADKQGIQIGLSHVFQAKDFSTLRWRWRAEQLPPGGNERAKGTNNSAAAVYVIFDSRMMPRVIKYVWSTTVPTGTRMNSPAYWRGKVIVLQSGATKIGEWHEETVNFSRDYKEFFGTEPGEVQGIALLTDSDETGSIAQADYDDFVLVGE